MHTATIMTALRARANPRKPHLQVMMTLSLALHQGAGLQDRPKTKATSPINEAGQLRLGVDKFESTRNWGTLGKFTCRGAMRVATMQADTRTGQATQRSHHKENQMSNNPEDGENRRGKHANAGISRQTK